MLLLAALLLAAVATDLRSRRIPNLLVIDGIVIAHVAHAAALLTGTDPIAGPAWWSPLAGMAIGLAALLPLYLKGACGAGDVKLMAMVGAFVGAKTVLVATVCTLLAGGLLALLFMLGRGVTAHTLGNLRVMFLARGARHTSSPISSHASSHASSGATPLARTAARLPYAVAIAMGTCAALLVHR